MESRGYWFFLIFFGLGYGGNNVMRSLLVREICRRRSFGAIFGFLVGINVLGGIAGPLLAGIVFDQMGSYRSIWHTYPRLTVAAMLARLTIRFTKSSPIVNTP